MKNPHRFHGPARQLIHAQQRTTALVNSDQDRRRFRSIGGRRLAVDELPGAGGIEIDHAPTRQPGLRGHYPGPQRGRRDLRDVRRRDAAVSSADIAEIPPPTLWSRVMPPESADETAAS